MYVNTYYINYIFIIYMLRKQNIILYFEGLFQQMHFLLKDYK